MYCVIKGEVEVIQDEEQLGFLPEGSFFGEAGLIDNGEGSEIRSRTVKAMVECELCYLRRDDLNALRLECPELTMKLRRFSRMGERVKPPRVDDAGNPRILHMMTQLTERLDMMNMRLARMERNDSLMPSPVPSTGDSPAGDMSTASGWRGVQPHRRQ